MSKAVIQNKNSGKTGFARCFWGVSKQFSRYSGAKKMEPMTGFDEEGFQPDEVPEQSEGNRLTVRIGYWRQPMSKAAEQTLNDGKIYFAR